MNSSTPSRFYTGVNILRRWCFYAGMLRIHLIRILRPRMSIGLRNIIPFDLSPGLHLIIRVFESRSTSDRLTTHKHFDSFLHINQFLLSYRIVRISRLRQSLIGSLRINWFITFKNIIIGIAQVKLIRVIIIAGEFIKVMFNVFTCCFDCVLDFCISVWRCLS